MRSKTVYLSLGSNLGDRRAQIEAGLAALGEEGVTVTARSSWYETEPQDVIQQPWFLNLVARGETARFPLQLLAALLKIERRLGRVRGAETVRRGPRILDIDILLYGDTVLETAELTVPHPRMLERRFVLEPLLEIAAELRHPITRRTMSAELRAVADQKIRRVE
jgi:2-amino-4-hydroxy-6-hydroxymethyldihydropteridine diphosphokinase